MAADETMFEGYYRITASNKPIGYSIQRYSYNDKKKQFTSKYYVRAKSPAGTLTETLTAVANNQFHPVSYQYTSQVGSKVTSIDAHFKLTKSNVAMTYTVNNGKQQQTFTKTISRDVFLSTFQVYLMLQKGLKAGTKFNFKAISEEDGEVRDGQAMVKNEPGFEDKGILRVLTKFKGIQSVANVNVKGEVIIAESPVQKIRQVLVPVPAEATKGFQFDTKAIKYVFGSIPTGQINQMVKNKKQAKASAAPAPGAKQESPPQQAIKINPPKSNAKSSN